MVTPGGKPFASYRGTMGATMGAIRQLGNERDSLLVRVQALQDRLDATQAALEALTLRVAVLEAAKETP